MIYVDDMMACIKNRNWRYAENCHLFADTVDELHIFAQSIGLRREWFQNKSLPHYDLTANKRRRAVLAGAKEVDRREFVQIKRRLSQAALAAETWIKSGA